ncbi:MAG TPA: hypothetical protein VF753_15085 [Terriglobales bacterium]
MRRILVLLLAVMVAQGYATTRKPVAEIRGQDARVRLTQFLRRRMGS